MLVLSRRTGEQVCVGSEIQVTVLSIKKGRVQLGFAAPGEFAIRRQELCPGAGFDLPQGQGVRASIAEGVA